MAVGIPINVQKLSCHNFILNTSTDDEHPNAIHYIRTNILCTYLHSALSCNIHEQYLCINVYNMYIIHNDVQTIGT